MPDFSQSLFPTLDDIMQRARSIVNDTFPGLAGAQGRILTNNAPFTISYLNNAFDTLQRKLRVEGVTFPKKVAILNNLIPLAAPNPNIIVYVGYNGYFDGFQMHAIPMLPSDLMQPYEVWEQDVGSNLPFVEMDQPQEGVQSSVQGQGMRVWEWRNYGIYMPGSLVAKNLWLRYKAGQPPLNVPAADFAKTAVNIADSATALAYMVAAQYAEARGADTTKLEAKIEDAISDMALEYVRQMQPVAYRRQPYSGPNTAPGMVGQTAGRNR